MFLYYWWCIGDIILKIDHKMNSLFKETLWTMWWRADLVEKENTNIITKKATLYCTITEVLPLRFELTFKRTYFIICQSPLTTALCIRLFAFNNKHEKGVVYTDDKT